MKFERTGPNNENVENQISSFKKGTVYSLNLFQFEVVHHDGCRVLKSRLPSYITIGSMYGMFTYIYHKNVGKYSIHGWYGI